MTAPGHTVTADGCDACPMPGDVIDEGGAALSRDRLYRYALAPSPALRRPRCYRGRSGGRSRPCPARTATSSTCPTSRSVARREKRAARAAAYRAEGKPDVAAYVERVGDPLGSAIEALLNEGLY